MSSSGRILSALHSINILLVATVRAETSSSNSSSNGLRRTRAMVRALLKLRHEFLNGLIFMDQLYVCGSAANHEIHENLYTMKISMLTVAVTELSHMTISRVRL